MSTDFDGSTSSIAAGLSELSSARLGQRAAAFEVVHFLAGNEVVALTRVLDDYRQDHVGPYLALITESAVEITTALERLVDGYGDLAGILRNGGAEVQDLEARASELEASRSGPDRDLLVLPFPFLDPELEAIRADERELAARLTADIDGLDAGPLPEIDVAALRWALERLAARWETNPLLDAALLGTAEGAWVDLLEAGLGAEPERLGAYHQLVTAGVDEATALAIASQGTSAFALALGATLAADPSRTAESVLNDVADAMEAGLTPDQVHLDEALFSPSYLRRFDGPTGTGFAAYLLYVHSGHGSWAGRRLARDVARGPADADGLLALAVHLADDGVLAAAFHNELGVEASANVLRLSDDSELGTALVASVAAAAGSGLLTFDGGDWYRAWDGRGLQPVQLLVSEPTMPDRFLVEAGIAAFNTQHAGRSSGQHTMMGYGPYSQPPPEIGPEGYLFARPLRLPGHPANETRPHGAVSDNPALVLLAHVANRGLRPALDIFQGTARPDLVLAMNPPYFPPTGPAMRNRLAEIVAALTDPDVTGDPDLSEEATVWAVRAAGARPDLNLPEPTALVVEEAILRNPSILVQAADPGVAPSGHLVRPERFGDVGDTTIDVTLDNLLAAGAGSGLVTYQAFMVPEAVMAAADAGGPEHLASGVWLGEIDGRIDRALDARRLAAAHDLDARNAMIRLTAGSVLSTLAAIALPYVFAAGAGATLAGAAGAGGAAGTGFGSSVGINMIVGYAVEESGFARTDNVTAFWRERALAENNEMLDLTAQMLGALAELGHLYQPGAGRLVPMTPDHVQTAYPAEAKMVWPAYKVQLAPGGPKVDAVEWFDPWSREFTIANSVREAATP